MMANTACCIASRDRGGGGGVGCNGDESPT